jgi:hypothetical protein
VIDTDGNDRPRVITVSSPHLFIENDGSPLKLHMQGKSTGSENVSPDIGSQKTNLSNGGSSLNITPEATKCSISPKQMTIT